jgi:hypothetical protein
MPYEQVITHSAIELKAKLEHFISSGPGGGTADQIKEVLKEEINTINKGVVTAVTSLHEQHLPSLRLWLADMPDSYINLKPWLKEVVADLEERVANLQPLMALASMAALQVAETASGSRVLHDGENGSSPYVGSLLPALGEYGWVDSLKKAPAIQPANGLALARSPAQTFNFKGDMALKLLATTSPALLQNFYQVVASAQLTQPSMVQVYALRTTASLFGHNAPKEIVYKTEGDNNGGGNDIIHLAEPLPQDDWPEWSPAKDEGGYRLFLDNAYNDILPNSYIAIQILEDEDSNSFSVLTSLVGQPVIRSRNAYGISGETTVLTLPDDETWWDPDGETPFTRFIRGTTVYAQSELLELAEAPISIPNKPVPVAGIRLELDGLYDGLETGRWLVVSGERSDINNARGVKADELVMIAGVEQSYDPTLPGDKPHTTLVLANEGLSYSYHRESVIIHANVAKATHGETRHEVLGSGDGKEAFQQFSLKQAPLTYVASPNRCRRRKLSGSAGQRCALARGGGFVSPGGRRSQLHYSNRQRAKDNDYFW